jgi:hypothetical protein
MDTLQDKSDRLKNFLGRFDALCVRTAIKTAEACRSIGVSRSLFYELRSGKREVTDKIMNRLAMAEREAGIGAAETPGRVSANGAAEESDWMIDFLQNFNGILDASKSARRQKGGSAGSRAIIDSNDESSLEVFKLFIMKVESFAAGYDLFFANAPGNKYLDNLAREITRDLPRLQSLFLDMAKALTRLREIEDPKPVQDSPPVK